MPDNEQVAMVDHRERAERYLGDARSMGLPMSGAPDLRLAIAQVHATLAIHNQLERLNDQLSEVIDPTASPSFLGQLRVRIEAS